MVCLDWLRTLQDWENPNAKGQAPAYLIHALAWLDLELRGGLAGAIEDAVARRIPALREKVEFELAREQAEQKPAPQWAVTGEPEQFTEPRPPAEKPLPKSFAQRQREDLVARATAKGVCADCGDKLPWCSC